MLRPDVATPAVTVVGRSGVADDVNGMEERLDGNGLVAVQTITICRRLCTPSEPSRYV